LAASRLTPIWAPMSYDTDLQLFIDGAWKSGEGRDAHTVINPATGGGIAEVPYASKADLDEALHFFEAALQKEPSYALAYAGIAEVWGARQQLSFAPPREEVKTI